MASGVLLPRSCYYPCHRSFSPRRAGDGIVSNIHFGLELGHRGRMRCCCRCGLVAGEGRKAEPRSGALARLRHSERGCTESRSVTRAGSGSLVENALAEDFGCSKSSLRGEYTPQLAIQPQLLLGYTATRLQPVITAHEDQADPRRTAFR